MATGGLIVIAYKILSVFKPALETRMLDPSSQETHGGTRVRSEKLFCSAVPGAREGRWLRLDGTPVQDCIKGEGGRKVGF